ncbi:MAG: extracellular solute-binding protein, partial [Acetatifactor sp.]|nr:extracellular solute-binding protein [Acetatifactor sp.]
QGQIAFRLVQDDSGCFYAMHEDQVYLFDADGVCQGSVPCPGESYIDMCAVAGDSVYVSYRDGQVERPMLARLQYQGGRLEGELRISGNGYLGAGREGNLLFQSGNEVYVYAPQKQEAERLLDLTTYDLTGELLQAMRMTSSGEIVLVSWELFRYDSPVWVTRLREAVEGQLAEDGRQIITWLVFSFKEDAEEIATVFNRQSKDYKVVVEEISSEVLTDCTTQFDLQEDAYMRANTRLLGSKSADLISFSSYQDMERYLAKGYLEDLTPYIAQSEKISREDYFDEILECYSSGNALYSIPPTFGIDTLKGKESELGAEPGWTVDEFLDWLAEHPDTVTWEGLSRENVLNFCLKGTLDEYLNWESGQCNFEGEDFQELLRRIGGLTTDSAEHWDLWEQMKEKPGIECGGLGTVASFTDCRSWELMYGEPMVYKGSVRMASPAITIPEVDWLSSAEVPVRRGHMPFGSIIYWRIRRTMFIGITPTERLMPTLCIAPCMSMMVTCKTER